MVDEVIEAGELAQPDLAAEFIKARHAVLAVADEVEGHDIERGVEARPQVEVLQELRMIAQLQKAEPLAAHRERPVRQPALMHLRRRLGAERIEYRNVAGDLVRIG